MTGDRISTSSSLLCAVLLAAVLTGSGCESAGRTQDVSFQVAGPVGGGSCEVTMTVGNPCVTVVAYEHGTRNQLPLVRPDDETRTERFKLRFEGTVTPRWDIAIAEGQRIDIQVLAYENDGAARYGAFIEDIDITAEEVLVRLYPFQEWSCPGSPATPRALHGAIAINEHQALIFGGVSGRDLDPLSARDPRAHGGALPVDSIELYDGRTHRFITLDIESFDGATFFRRTLFDSVLVEENRVRVIGGFTGPAGSPLLHLDNVGTRAPFGSPFLPSVMAEVGRTVDLVVDSATATVRIEDAEFSAPVPRGGLLEISDFFGAESEEDPALVLIGLAPDGTMFAPTALTYEYTREGGTGDIRMLANQRMGASVIPFSAGFVIWGGNVGHGGDVLAAAGEFLTSGTEDGVPVPAGGDVPPPTAFHSGTNTGEGQALVAGGFRVADDGFVYNTPPSASVYFVNVGAGPTLDVRPVDVPGTHVNTMYHTATPVPGLGVALLGGAGVDPPGAAFGTGNRLAPQAQAAFVNGAAYTAVGSLTMARWGHTATVLSGHRLLVVGGFVRDTDTAVANGLEAVQTAELYYWDPPPRDLFPDECAMDTSERDDAAVDGMDSGIPPRRDAGTDAGAPMDAGFDGEAGLSEAGSEAGVDAG